MKIKNIITLRWNLLIGLSILIIGYISLSIWSNSFSLISVTKEIVIQGKIEPHKVLDYPYEKKLIEIISQLFLTGIIGILISVLINRTIEKKRSEQEKKAIEDYRKLKEEEIESLHARINESVFEALFKKLVHEATFRLVKEQIFKTKAIRKHAHWFFKFTDNIEGGLNLCQQVVYELENAGLEILKDPIVLTTDEKENISLNSAHASIDGLTILDFVAAKDLIKDSEKKYMSNKDYVQVGYDVNGNFTVEIKTEIPPHKTASFSIEYMTNYKSQYIRDGYFTKYPLIDVLIKFDFPQNWVLDVFFTINTNKTIMADKEGTYIANIDGGFLPGQGCVFTLKKAKVPSLI